MQNSITQHSPTQPIRIFIGSSSRNVLEEKVFVYSLQKYSSLPIEVNILDGETGSVRFQNGEVKELPATVRHAMKGATAFSLARFAIPQWCNYQGRAIYCDSDQLLLQDLAELWNMDLEGAGATAVHVRDAESNPYYVNSFLKSLMESSEDYYLTSVMLMDCEQLKTWDIEAIVEQFNQGKFSYSEMMFFGKAFTQSIPTEVKRLPTEWNHLDVLTQNTKLVHFTDLTSQPWLFHHNKTGTLWERFYLEAIEQGFVPDAVIQQAYEKGVISKRIRDLAQTHDAWGRFWNEIWRTWLAFGFLLRRRAKFVLARLQLRQAVSH